ncbi:MAG: UvrD-helicase domain-containing protein [Bacteroidota bacterium]
MSFHIDDNRQSILDANGHLLIEGGPGSGKTTIALLKAKNLVEEDRLSKGQQVLFLSFARATLARVEEQAKKLITAEQKRKIEINTYHSFAWSLIKSFGYLLHQYERFQLITPPNLFARMAHVETDDEREKFKENLLTNEGVICFDLFARTAARIIEKSDRVCQLIAHKYPFIIVDEFQDTDRFEWKIIQSLGKYSKIIALADLNQRIFEFRGASITRIPEFDTHFSPQRVDFGLENNRSSNTDIVQFGDDLLTGKNIGKNYQNVEVVRYKFYQEPKLHLKAAISNSIKRIKKTAAGGEISVAILVNSKDTTLQVSNYLAANNFHHEVMIDPEGPALSAAVIALLLQPLSETENNVHALTTMLINHIKGRRGEKIAKKNLELANHLESFVKTGKVKGPAKTALVTEIGAIAGKRKQLLFNGIPEQDWLAVRRLFQNGQHEAIRHIYEDAQYIRLLNRGAVLSETLSEMWRSNGCYLNALNAVETALTQEHFAMANRKWNGIFVMNVHKAKGKEFDEVIIWEEKYKEIVYQSDKPGALQQSKLLLRVAVTRARSRTTFLTPGWSPCILL